MAKERRVKIQRRRKVRKPRKRRVTPGILVNTVVYQKT